MIRKGYNPAVDSYSGFFENDHRTPTGLAGLLRELALETPPNAGGDAGGLARA